MTTSQEHIEVAVDLPLFKTYTYRVPQPMVALTAPGKRVWVPFGRRRVSGYLLGEAKAPGHTKIKAILDVLDDRPLFPSHMVPFFRWISDYYVHPLGQVIKTALPGGINRTEVARMVLTEAGLAAMTTGFLTPLELTILNRLKKAPARLSDLKRECGREVPRALVHTLGRRGWIQRQQQVKRGTTRSRREKYVAPAPSAPSTDHMSAARKKVIRFLQAHGETSFKELKSNVPSAGWLIKPLVESGHVISFDKKRYRDPFGNLIQSDTPLPLTTQQQEVVPRLVGALGQGFSAYLLTGVTGSGKTEVYLQSAAAAVEQRKSALVLVPEIALISQTERRFRARFGDIVAVLHSGLSAGQRYDQWMRIVSGAAPIVIGARSAVFAPLPDVGLIVVDEEHDSSYKQENGLRYNARDLAVMRAKMADCVVLLGSATPSVQSIYNAQKGKFTPLGLTRRVFQRPLPEIDVLDLRRISSRRGSQRLITPPLQAAMAKTLGRGEQVLLFLNRRGFASLPLCADCGSPMRCSYCDIALTLHQNNKTYECHYCGHRRRAVSTCPNCGSPRIRHLGWGTEKVASMVKSLFPGAAVARMDRDTVRRKGALLKMLKGLQDKTIDVLVGTQMIAKGHDFPDITLVGIICADLSLNFPDFRAGERTFQLLAQVAGRAGRGEAPGRVILQTYNPTHFSIQAARSQDVHAFYNQEIEHRRSLNYPPVSKMALLKISGKEKTQTDACARRLKDACVRLQAGSAQLQRDVTLLGPIEAAIPRVANRYRRQILIKGARTKVIQRFVHQLVYAHRKLFQQSGIRIAVDIDPMFMI